MRNRLILGAIAMISLVAIACSSSEDPTATPTQQPSPTAAATQQQAPSDTIVDVAVADGRFTTLVAALQAAELADTLSGNGPFTVFAPTDDAFAALPEGTVEGLLADIPALTEVLTYHVVSGSVDAATVIGLDSATTLQGEDVAISVVNNSVMINDSKVIIADIETSNGIIHVIDAVLLPPADTEPTPTPAPSDTIVDVAVADGRFTTLVAALQAADLADTLSGDGPFTVFAPTDDAFAALPEGTVEGLLADIPALTEVLTYHVVSGSVDAATVIGLDSATTLQGEDVAISVVNNSVMINDSKVIIADIETSNGIIHVIDAVLLPPADTEPTPTPAPSNTIVDVAVADGRFTTLVAALQAADLADTLSGDGPFTVFAPTDDAFAALPEGTVEGLLADIPALTDVLTYHVVQGQVLAADVVSLSSATTLQGSDVSVQVTNGNVFINGAQVIITDIVGSNGVIHVIDAVLIPGEEPPVQNAPQTSSIVEIAAGDDRFDTLVAALEAADLVGALSGDGPFTVFAPTDDAFAKLPEGTLEALLADIPALVDVLTYHVVSGEVSSTQALSVGFAESLQGSNISIQNVYGGLTLNSNTRVLDSDIQASNGVIHSINRVMLPPEFAFTEMEPTIIDIATGDDRFETLVTALAAADLVDTLAGEGEFTVFAPTDDAFAALPAGTVEALLNDIPALTDILFYHVVSGTVLAEDVVTLTSTTTLQGDQVTVSVQNGAVFINNAQVIITDIVASNGVVHVIDTVLLPPSE